MKVSGAFFKANIAEGGKTQFGDFVLFHQDCPMPLHKTLEHPTFLIVTKLTTKMREGNTKSYDITNKQLVAIPYELIDSIAEVQGIEYYE